MYFYRISQKFILDKSIFSTTIFKLVKKYGSHTNLKQWMTKWKLTRWDPSAQYGHS